MARVLVVEDEPNLRFSIRQALKKAGHETAEAPRTEAGWEATRQAEFDLVLTDVNLGSGEDGIAFTRRLREDGFEGAIVVMTAYGTVETAVSAMKQGADDYLQKPVSLEELTLLVARLIETRRARTRLKLYERMQQSQTAERGIIGKSPAWLAAVATAERLAALPLPAPRADGSPKYPSAGGALPTILILGDTGTGKGLLARHIHATATAGEPTAPFVHINCAALPAALVESELFGHERGAFTDAKGVREGLFELAEGGTVFLDEIGELPLDLQAKLLTVIEEGVFRRVGGSKDKSVRARVIAATNQDLERRVEAGKFRRDLFYRLNAFTIRLPALAERGDDCLLLAADMLDRFSRQYGRPSLKLTDEARDAIRRHHWPGNVRELINAMQHAAMLCDRPVVGAEDLGLTRVRAVRKGGEAPAPAGPSTNGELVFDFDHGLHKAEDIERELIIQSLKRTGGNVSKAAKLIGMQRSSFRYRIDRFQLDGLVQEISRR